LRMEDLPIELLFCIVERIEDPLSFLYFSLACKKVNQVCKDEVTLERMKLKFSKKHVSLQHLFLNPGNERVCIRHFSTLPCGWKYGEDIIWNYKVKLQLTIKGDGLCLQGIVDYQDKLPACRREWKDDKLFGKETAWHANGNILFLREWNDDGRLEGEEQQWYDDGTLKEHSFRYNGDLEGVQRGWHEDGTPSFVRLWRKGIQEGTEKQWNPEGELIVHTEWPHSSKGKKIDLLKKKTKRRSFFGRRKDK